MMSLRIPLLSDTSLIPHGSTIVLGLSGGPDSMFLLHMLAQSHQAGTITLIAAHLDHEWRATSAADAQFCLGQAHTLGIACIIEKMSQLPTCFRWNGSQEEIGRKARRIFLESVADRQGAHAIALAHHAQDQQETFFIRLIRGTSLEGLTAMKVRSGRYIRPLLHISKQEILSYLHEHKIPYLNDETNTSDKYLRNRIRMSVLPAIRTADTRFDTNFAHTLDRLQSAHEYVQIQARQILVAMSRNDAGKLCLDTTQLSTLHPAMRYQVLSLWLTKELVTFTPTEAFFDEIMRFASTTRGGTHQICDGWSLLKRKGWIWVQK